MCSVETRVPINSLENQLHIESLLLEIRHLLHLRKTDSLSLAAYLFNKPPNYLALENLEHPHTLIRRLTSILICLIFEQNSELLRTSELRSSKKVCFLDSSLFLCRASPAIRNSRPEPLYHVENPLCHYLPRNSFPKGQVCYLDLEKLTNILIGQEYLRLPDPKEQVVWLMFEHILEPTNSWTKSDGDKSDTSSDDEDPQCSGSPTWQSRRPAGTAIRVLAQFAKIASKRADKEAQKVAAREAKAQQSVNHSTTVSGVHRIKCFQFFRKQKEQTTSSTTFSEQSVRSVSLLLPELPPRIQPPQFESVNDWATDKENTSHYSTQIKYIPVNESGNLLFEVAEEVTETQDNLKESTPNFNPERLSGLQKLKSANARIKAFKVVRKESLRSNDLQDNTGIDSASFVSQNSSDNRRSDSRGKSQEFRINNTSTTKKPSNFALLKLKSQESNVVVSKQFSMRMRSLSLETQSQSNQPQNHPSPNLSKFRVSRDRSASGKKVSETTTTTAKNKPTVESRLKSFGKP